MRALLEDRFPSCYSDFILQCHVVVMRFLLFLQYNYPLIVLNIAPTFPLQRFKRGLLRCQHLRYRQDTRHECVTSISAFIVERATIVSVSERFWRSFGLAQHRSPYIFQLNCS